MRKLAEEMLDVELRIQECPGNQLGDLAAHLCLRLWPPLWERNLIETLGGVILGFGTCGQGISLSVCLLHAGRERQPAGRLLRSWTVLQAESAIDQDLTGQGCGSYPSALTAAAISSGVMCAASYLTVRRWRR